MNTFVMLFRILELFQKNITLENEMVERLFALRRARAKALQEQMTPHFLCNALQSINWIAIAETGQDESATSRALILLADIIRSGKEQKYSLTTVKKEIDYTQKFVKMEKLRFGMGIECRFFVDPDAQNMLIPAISLQTLVENSIKHGFRAKGGCGEWLKVMEGEAKKVPS
ncbi:MAG: histidine kinase [Lachnospiraceae bacterium]|nr:histidine kinase [Lachnospiraceae bacterium]